MIVFTYLDYFFQVQGKDTHKTIGSESHWKNHFRKISRTWKNQQDGEKLQHIAVVLSVSLRAASNHRQVQEITPLKVKAPCG